MSRSPSPETGGRRSSVVGTPRAGGGTDLSGGNPQPKKFMNGWTKEQETLMADWADIAGCYRWLNDRAEKIYSRSNMLITIPVIVLSTLTGTANFAIGSFISENDPETKKFVSAGIGGFSIFAGILTTLGNFFQYAQKSEAHRVAGVAWGKFQRQVTVELAIHPDERIEAMDFLKICRQDLDRLIEQSPAIPDPVIAAFEKEFKHIPNLKVPDICHGIEHTRVYDASKARLTKITADAALHLKYKKGVLKESILPDIDRKIEQELNGRIEERIRRLIPVLAPAPVVQPVEPEPEVVITPPAYDWRKLIVSRRNLLEAPVAPTAHENDEIYRDTMSAETPASLDSVIMNIVGTDGPQSMTASNSVVDLSAAAGALSPPTDLSGAQVV